MKEKEVILKAIAGEIKWIHAADILGISYFSEDDPQKAEVLHGVWY